MDKRFSLEDQIEMFASALKGEVITPRSDRYDALRMVALGNFDMHPAAVIRVANATDIAAVLNFAQATDLPVAIRSGGRSTLGNSGTEGGLVVDLRDLDGIDVDAGACTVWAGTGNTAGTVSAAVEKHGLIVGFGDSASVGIGGLTLGGGIGYMVRKYGLTIDSLLAAEVVTAAGDIVVADADHHRDLFWALRGGGGNFGVVTRLKFRLHPLRSFVGGPLILPATAEVLAGFAAAAAAAPDELSTIGMVMPIPPVPFVPAEMHAKLVLIGMLAFAGGRGQCAHPVPAPRAPDRRPRASSALYQHVCHGSAARTAPGRVDPFALSRDVRRRRSTCDARRAQRLRRTHEDGTDPRARRGLRPRACRSDCLRASQQQDHGGVPRHA